MQATVLIIDDNVTLARAFERVLTLAGYRVHTWHSAEDGLRQAKTERPDAIILDVQMPFVNGLGFLYRLRLDPSLSSTPVMVVTGAALSEQQMAELDELGASVRTKPIGVDELITGTREMIGDSYVTPSRAHSPAAARNESVGR